MSCLTIGVYCHCCMGLFAENRIVFNESHGHCYCNACLEMVLVQILRSSHLIQGLPGYQCLLMFQVHQSDYHQDLSVKYVFLFSPISCGWTSLTFSQSVVLVVKAVNQRLEDSVDSHLAPPCGKWPL